MDIQYISNDNNTQGSKFYFQENLGVGIPSLIISVVCIATGTVGNVLVIGAVLSHKKLRKVGNAFIVNLAIADLTVTAFVSPFSVVGLFFGKDWFMERYELCVAISAMCLASCATSLLNIGAVSFNRYVHIVHHNYYDKIYTLRNSLLMCLGLWILSFTIVMPTFFDWGGHRYDEKTEMCVWNRVADFSYTIFCQTIGLILPIILTAVCYVKIFLFVRAQKKKIAAQSMNKDSGMSSKSKKESTKLARTLFIIFIVFVSCWAPYTLVTMADRNDTFPKELHFFVILLAHTNSSLNGIVYGLADKNFRSGYMHILGIDKCAEKFARRSDTFDANSASDTPDNTTIKKTTKQKGSM